MASTSQPSKTYCAKGQRDCKRFELKGQCEGDCPIVVREQKLAAEGKLPKVKKSLAELYHEPVDVDIPFELADLVAITGPEYVEYMSKPELSIARFNILLSQKKNTTKH
ncbi:MAG: hypothetical protein N3A72_11925 [bacterium]|nr:hypothetical protein [bacterium]